MTGVVRVEGPGLLTLTRDARVVAIRWDLVPWGLVLDLDVPVSEGEGVPIRRAWIVFSGVSDITWPMRQSRLPNGVWLGSAVVTTPFESETEYSFTALLPTFRDDGTAETSPSHVVVVRAQGLRAVASVNAVPPGECGPAWADRTALARDEDLLAALVESQSEGP